MALTARLSEYDTWSELERALAERYWDALALATDAQGRLAGAVYVWGYVAEMLLKVAYYRVRRVGPLENLANELAGMRQRANELNVEWHGNLHSLRSLATLLIEERSARREPMDPGISISLDRHVTGLTENWLETLRYKEVQATAEEASDVYESVDWLYAQYPRLWS